MTFVFPSINGRKPEERSGHVAVHFDGYIVVWGGYHRVRIDYHFENKRLWIHSSGDTLTLRFIGSPEVRNVALPRRCSAVASCLCCYFKILSPASPGCPPLLDPCWVFGNPCGFVNRTICTMFREKKGQTSLGWLMTCRINRNEPLRIWITKNSVILCLGQVQIQIQTWLKFKIPVQGGRAKNHTLSSSMSPYTLQSNDYEQN